MIFDISAWAMWHSKHLGKLKALIGQAQTHFPERLHRVLLCNNGPALKPPPPPPSPAPAHPPPPQARRRTCERGEASAKKCRRGAQKDRLRQKRAAGLASETRAVETPRLRGGSGHKRSEAAEAGKRRGCRGETPPNPPLLPARSRMCPFAPPAAGEVAHALGRTCARPIRTCARPIRTCARPHRSAAPLSRTYALPHMRLAARGGYRPRPQC
jgi:hypothetical protein